MMVSAVFLHHPGAAVIITAAGVLLALAAIFAEWRKGNEDY